MAQGTTDLAEQARTGLRRRALRTWRRWRGKAHEYGEIPRVGQHFRCGTDGGAMVGAGAVAVQDDSCVLWALIENTAGYGSTFVGKQFIGYALLNVISFSSEDQQRLFLRLPSKASNRTVIATGVERAADPKLEPGGLRRSQVRPQRGIRRVLDQAQAKQRGWDAENHIVERNLLGKFWLRESAAGSVRAAGDGVKIVNSAIR